MALGRIVFFLIIFKLNPIIADEKRLKMNFTFSLFEQSSLMETGEPFDIRYQ